METKETEITIDNKKSRAKSIADILSLQKYKDKSKLRGINMLF